MTSAPLLVGFLLFQRQFVQSFMRAGIGRPRHPPRFRASEAANLGSFFSTRPASAAAPSGRIASLKS